MQSLSTLEKLSKITKYGIWFYVSAENTESLDVWESSLPSEEIVICYLR